MCNLLQAWPFLTYRNTGDPRQWNFFIIYKWNLNLFNLCFKKKHSGFVLYVTVYHNNCDHVSCVVRGAGSLYSSSSLNLKREFRETSDASFTSWVSKGLKQQLQQQNNNERTEGEKQMLQDSVGEVLFDHHRCDFYRTTSGDVGSMCLRIMSPMTTPSLPPGSRLLSWLASSQWSSSFLGEKKWAKPLLMIL